MNKNRLEAFSDGVFAIVITLLILDIRLPQVEYSELAGALRELIPNIVSYVVSFAVIGLYWIGHHYYMRHMQKINGIFIWLNMAYLLAVSFIPFPTTLLGEYPFEKIPVIFYGANLLIVNIISLIMLRYVYKHKELATEGYTIDLLRRFFKLFLKVNIGYVLAVILAFFAPVVSYGLYILGLIFGIYLYARRED